ncbi:MAG TPA: prolyl oligopeptidase family serine peptidase [Vicinamibacterales bacterium]|jgi:dipeptidyl aminopeptidase/acylaminoacyl peptidase
MRIRTPARRWSLVLAALALWAIALNADSAFAQKKPITHDVYDTWRSIQGTKLSRDGGWLVYALAAQEGDGELVARNLKTDAEIRQPRGKDPVITANGKYVLYGIAPPRADVDKAKKDKKKADEMPKSGFGILDLSTGKAVTFDRVKSFKVPEESAAVVAFLFEAPEKKADASDDKDKKVEAKPEEKRDGKKKNEKKKEPGTDLVVRNLADGGEVKIAEVTDYEWAKSGDLLAYTVSSKKPESDGAFVRKTADGSVRSVLTGLGNYKGIAFDDAGGQLAFVSDRDDYKAEAPAFRLYAWSSPGDKAIELVSAASPGMPAGAAVSEYGKLEFSKDGSRLLFGTAPAPKAVPEGAPDPAKVDIWTWKDPELQPMQKVRLEEEKKRSFRAAVSLKNRKFVQLADSDMPDIRLSEDATRALGQSDVPYRQLVSWDGEYADFYAVNPLDGSRKKIIEKAHFGATLSPAGAYVLYFDYRDTNWYVVRNTDGKVIKLTDKSLGVRFDDETSNTPEPPRPWGVAGWTEGDRSLLVYDRYDIWELRPDGTAPRTITNGVGRKQKLVFRYQRPEADEAAVPRGRRVAVDEQPIKLDKPLLLQATDDTTKASGFYRVTVPPVPAAVAADARTAKKASRQGGAGAESASAASTGPGSGPALQDPTKLLMLDKMVGGFIKAKGADTVVITEQRFEEFPNLWVTDLSLANPRKVTDANPQQGTYVWGRSELIEYVNADNVTLRAILTKPENFDPSKKYPLLVYIYEELTDGLHRFVPPAPGTSINVSRFVSNGYIVLRPDIIYDTGYPGQSALKCVLPAVQRVVSMGFVDPKRVGIQGHSWGGYQITYLITQTNMFRAVEAGASVSNMVSAYGGIRWGTGMSRAFQYEKTQSRIGAPPWERPLQFIENSPIFWVEKVKTPYLTIHNDEDDAVPWYQGIEFFSALRRLGKEAYMFVYNGEKHGLRERDNQKHWTVHLCEFFDHHLKDAPRPEWMDKGVPYLEKGKRDVSGQFKGK